MKLFRLLDISVHHAFDKITFERSMRADVRLCLCETLFYIQMKHYVNVYIV